MGLSGLTSRLTGMGDIPLGSGETWTPDSLTGLQLWLTAGPTWCFSDTAGTIPCASGDEIKCWRARTGSALAIDFTQSAAVSTQRRLVQDAGGKWYVELGGGANDYLENTAVGLATSPVGVCCGVAVRPGTQASSIFTLFCFGASGSSNTLILLRGDSTALPNTRWQGLVAGAFTSTIVTDTVAYTAGADVRYIGRCDPVTLDTFRLWENGAPVASTARTATLYTIAGTTWRIGTDTFDVNRRYTGRLYGLVLTNVDVSDGEASRLDSYLASLAI